MNLRFELLEHHLGFSFGHNQIWSIFKLHLDSLDSLFLASNCSENSEFSRFSWSSKKLVIYDWSPTLTFATV